MILHLVLVQFASGVEESQVAEFIERIKAHNRRIPQVQSMEIGHHLERDEELNELPYGALVSKDYPYCFLLRFNSAEALATYLNHPDHEQLGEEFLGIVEKIRVLDFIVAEDKPSTNAPG